MPEKHSPNTRDRMERPVSRVKPSFFHCSTYWANTSPEANRTAPNAVSKWSVNTHTAHTPDLVHKHLTTPRTYARATQARTCSRQRFCRLRVRVQGSHITLPQSWRLCCARRGCGEARSPAQRSDSCGAHATASKPPHSACLWKARVCYHTPPHALGRHKGPRAASAERCKREGRAPHVGEFCAARAMHSVQCTRAAQRLSFFKLVKTLRAVMRQFASS